MTKLFLVHCGFYDLEVLDGNYESHVNFFVAALDFDDARAKAKILPDFLRKRMHVDGIQEIQAVGGHHVTLRENTDLKGETLLISNKTRELAPKKT